MANPFVANQTFGINMQNLKSMYQMIMNSSNPQALFMNLARQNPQLRPIANALSQGVSPQQVFNQMCQQRGINPQDFINTLKGNNT